MSKSDQDARKQNKSEGADFTKYSERDCSSGDFRLRSEIFKTVLFEYMIFDRIEQNDEHIKNLARRTEKRLHHEKQTDIRITFLQILSNSASGLNELAHVCFNVAQRLVPESQIYKPPGFRLHAFAEFVYSKRTFETVFEPILRDLQDEFTEALSGGRPYKASMVRIRGYLSFWSAVVWQLPISMAKKVVALWKAVS